MDSQSYRARAPTSREAWNQINHSRQAQRLHFQQKMNGGKKPGDAGYRRQLLEEINPIGFRKRIWHFSTAQLAYFRLSLSPLGQASASGARSTSWKVMAMTTPARMLMYGKEASNRKQEIDRQHYTIPNQRPKDKHCGKI